MAVRRLLMVVVVGACCAPAAGAAAVWTDLSNAAQPVEPLRPAAVVGGASRPAEPVATNDLVCAVRGRLQVLIKRVSELFKSRPDVAAAGTEPAVLNRPMVAHSTGVWRGSQQSDIASTRLQRPPSGVSGTVPPAGAQRHSRPRGLAKAAPPSAGKTAGSHAAVVKDAAETHPVNLPRRGVLVNPTRAARNSLIKTFAALAGVIVLIVLVAKLAKRYLPAAKMLSGGGVIKVLARSQLGGKQSLCLVKLGNRVVLLGITSEQISPLCIIDDPTEVAMLCGRGGEHPDEGAAFPRLFGQQLQQFERIDTVVDDAQNDLAEDREIVQARGEVRSLLNTVRRLTSQRRVG